MTNAEMAAALRRYRSGSASLEDSPDDWYREDVLYAALEAGAKALESLSAIQADNVRLADMLRKAKIELGPYGTPSIRAEIIEVLTKHGTD